MDIVRILLLIVVFVLTKRFYEGVFSFFKGTTVYEFLFTLFSFLIIVGSVYGFIGGLVYISLTLIVMVSYISIYGALFTELYYSYEDLQGFVTHFNRRTLDSDVIEDDVRDMKSYFSALLSYKQENWEQVSDWNFLYVIAFMPVAFITYLPYLLGAFIIPVISLIIN